MPVSQLITSVCIPLVQGLLDPTDRGDTLPQDPYGNTVLDSFMVIGDFFYYNVVVVVSLTSLVNCCTL